MEVIKITKEQLVPAIWSGGQTFQYYIFPESSVYSDYDFLFRISSATLETAPSTFTYFEGYERYLLMLDSPLSIKINDKQYELNKTDIIQFKSKDNCTANSKGSDFNLMVNSNIPYHELSYRIDSFTCKVKHCILYSLIKNVITINTVQYEMDELTCLVINNLDAKKIALTLKSKCLVGLIDY